MRVWNEQRFRRGAFGLRFDRAGAQGRAAGWPNRGGEGNDGVGGGVKACCSRAYALGYSFGSLGTDQG